MKKIIILITCLLLLSNLMIMEIRAQNQTLTLMTYNIYHGEDPYNLGNSNIRDIAALIVKIKPDLVALQEVDSMTNRTKGFNPDGKKDLVKELEKLTGMTGYFAKAIDFSEGGYGEGILSRHQAEFESFDLPTPKGGEGRSLAVAKVDVGNGKEFIFAGTHLCHEFEENRTAQVKAIKNILSSYSLPTVVTGDFNFTSEENGYKVLAENYTDAALTKENPQNTYSSLEAKIRIDYFWLENKTEWEIISVEVLDVAFSDHKPLVVKVRW